MAGPPRPATADADVAAAFQVGNGRAPLQEALTAPVEGRPALATAVR
jgi:hypothetical protein